MIGGAIAALVMPPMRLVTGACSSSLNSTFVVLRYGRWPSFIVPLCLGLSLALALAGMVAVPAFAVRSQITLLTQQQCNSPYGLARDRKTGTVFAACDASFFSESYSSSDESNPVTVRMGFGGNLLSVIHPENPLQMNISTVLNSTTCEFVQGVAFDSEMNWLMTGCVDSTSIGASVLGAFVSNPADPGSNLEFDELANEAECNTPMGFVIDPLRQALVVACEESVISIPLSNHAIGQDAVESDRDVIMLLNSTQCINAQSVDVDAKTGDVYSACLGSPLVSVDALGKVTTYAEDQCSNSSFVHFDDSNRIVYAACWNQSIASVIRVDVKSGNVETILSGGPLFSPGSLALDVQTGTLYIGDINGVLAVLKNNTLVLVTDPGYCRGANSLLVDDDSGNVFVACHASITPNFGFAVLLVEGMRQEHSGDHLLIN
jgi:hypothetical protein